MRPKVTRYLERVGTRLRHLFTFLLQYLEKNHFIDHHTNQHQQKNATIFFLKKKKATIRMTIIRFRVGYQWVLDLVVLGLGMISHPQFWVSVPNTHGYPMDNCQNKNSCFIVYITITLFTQTIKFILSRLRKLFTIYCPILYM